MRALRTVGLVVGILVAVLVVAVVGLAVTTPGPEDRPGWDARAEMLFPRSEVGFTVHPTGGEERLVVAGGIARPAVTSDRVSVYDPEADRWDELPRLPAPRHHAAMASVREGVVLTGGAESLRDWTPRGNVWLLRDGADVWEGLEPMPEGRHSHRVVSIDGRIFVVGGWGESADVLVWDRNDGWSRGAPLPVPRHHLGVVVLDGEIWALGGRNYDETVLDTVHVYDPETDEWRVGPRLPFPVSAAVEAVIDGVIHLVGGEDPAVPGGRTLDRHVVLRPGAEAWEPAPPAPVAVHGAAGGVLDGRLVVAGGGRRHGILTPLGLTGVTSAFDPEELR